MTIDNVTAKLDNMNINCVNTKSDNINNDCTIITETDGVKTKNISPNMLEK